MKILVIGGSRFVGPLLLEGLLEHKHAITVFNRGNLVISYPRQIRFIKGDRDRGFDIKERFDAVVDMCAYTGRQMKIALRDLKFDYYYFLNFGTVAAHRQSQIFPITEDFPIGIYPAWGEYNKGKVECELVLKNSNVKCATIRPTYILGPKNYCDRENFIYSRIKKGEPLLIPGNGQAMTQFVFADEVVHIIVGLLERKVLGPFNIAGNEVITLVGLVEMMGEIMGKRPKMRFNPTADGARYKEEEFPFSNENLIVSNEKVKNMLEIKFLSLKSGLGRDWRAFYKNVI